MRTEKTTARTLFLSSEALPKAIKGTQCVDGLFYRDSGVIADLGGDPGEWLVATPRLTHHHADHDVDGFQSLKGSVSAARFRDMDAHMGMKPMTLAEFIALEKHPLNKGGISLEATQAAYAGLEDR